MQVATGALSTLLPKLGDLLKGEYKLQKGVRGEIMFLTAELKSMQNALLAVSNFPIDQPPNGQVKLWAKEVRELSYDLEDKIDKFMVRVDHAPNQLHGLRGFIDRAVNLLTKAKIRHKICTDIKDIKTRIKEVRERRDSYKVDTVSARPTGISVDSLRLLALYKKTTELVGTEEKSDNIVKMLMEQGEASKQQLKIVSIYGMGGLGKTTLANVVYNKLKGQFDCGAFVTASFNPLVDKILQKMLYQLEKDKYGDIHEKGWDEEQLKNELRDHLRDKRYFIVIDDIWEKSVWETIRCVLIDNEQGSIIITTTRNHTVAGQAGGAYQLKALSMVESRKLFYLRIFEMWGVPLAIITIASMLASNKQKDYTYEYWSKVYRSLASGLKVGSEVEDMRRILSVSYYDLPVHLRTCLLYLSLYPEDYWINTKDLIFKWICEGFIPEEQGKTMYEAGEDFVYELINRSLVEPRSIGDDNKASFCCLHDMVLDLISCLANEEEFLTTLRGQLPVDIPNKIRRLAIHTNNEKDVRQLLTMSLSHVRSLFVFNCSLISLVQALSSFPVIRVLDLRSCSQVDNHHFKLICNLFQLRYLVLDSTGITKIPKEIGNLKFLRLLNIRGNQIVELPSSFVQLQQLLYLDMTLLTLGKENLQVLANIPSLYDLAIWVKEPAQGRDQKLVIDNGYPFLCLRKFRIRNNMELTFGQGAMRNLQTLQLSVQETMDQFGQSGFGLEHLSSLENVHVQMLLGQAKSDNIKAAEAAIQKAVEMNPKRPMLEFGKICELKLKLMNVQPHEVDKSKRKILKSVSMLDGISCIGIDRKQWKLTVCGTALPSFIIENLQKEGIQAEPWGFQSPSTSGTTAVATISEPATILGGQEDAKT
ncbi:hypothetical protein ACP4OV_027195 [Aristida adscensionis]